jgi:flagellar basal-body rod protein FlgF
VALREEEKFLSTKGVFTAVSGAMAQSARMDTIANNLANVNTPAFKKDGQVFKEYLTSYEKQMDVIEAPREPASIESFYNMQGGDKSYVDQAGTFTDYSQGSLKTTGNPLDIALEGKGFFEVLSPQGIRYTRNGTFHIDAEGRLVNKDGYPVLTAGSQAPQERVIRMQGDVPLNISRQGELNKGEQNLGLLSVVNIRNQDAFQKVGSSMYKLRDNVAAQTAPATDVVVHQGSIEASNVNIVQEMTDMIGATRTFETTQKAIQAYDQMNDKLINTVPKF